MVNMREDVVSLACKCANFDPSCIVYTGAGLEKRYTLNCLESEIMQASVDKDSLPTYLLAEASELSRCFHCCQLTAA